MPTVTENAAETTTFDPIPEETTTTTTTEDVDGVQTTDWSDSNDSLEAGRLEDARKLAMTNHLKDQA